MRTSQNIDLLAAALVLAQGEFEGIEKNKVNPQFKSKHSNIDAVLEAARPTLSKHGLCLIQPLSYDLDSMIITSRLIHKSGQWIEELLHIKPIKDDPQGRGSAATYGRRYAAKAMLGLADEDDDGEASMNRARLPKQTTVKKEIWQDPEDVKKKLGIIKGFKEFDVDESILEHYVAKASESWGKRELDTLTNLGKEFREGKKDREGLYLSLSFDPKEEAF